MIIKCPQCATGYNIPDEIIADKPRRMRCTKCRTMFTVARHSEQPPAGYVEYTGNHSLPTEFAFLRKSAVPSDPVAAPPNAGDGNAQEAYQDYYQEMAPPAAAAAPTPVPSVPVTASASPASDVTPSAPAVQRSSLDLFNSDSRASWENEAPLELSGYSLHHTEMPDSRHHQRIGKVVFGISFLIVTLLVFVAWRNGWSLSPLDLPEQIAFAFSGEPREVLPDAVKNLEPVVLKNSVVVDSAGKTLLSVTGDIYNNNPTARGNVLLRGRLRDASGTVRAETRLPCGRAHDDLALRNHAGAGVRNLFLVEGQLYDCHIAARSSTLFQLVFEDVPDYNAAYTVEVVAVAAVVK